MSETQNLISKIEAYHAGIKEGLWRHAWWKDGEQYVGNMGKTLKEAQDQVDAECAKTISKYQENQNG